jgi:hypothetical protein
VWQEYVNEDLTVMKKELQQWKEEYAKRNDVWLGPFGWLHEPYESRLRGMDFQAMVKELKDTEDALRPLRSELQNVEEKIREYQAAIVGVKVQSCLQLFVVAVVVT